MVDSVDDKVVEFLSDWQRKGPNRHWRVSPIGAGDIVLQIGLEGFEASRIIGRETLYCRVNPLIAEAKAALEALESRVEAA